MWVLAGRSDVELLKFFLPRAPDFSDDGKVWRAGYGPRLRNWHGFGYSNSPMAKIKMSDEQLKEFKEHWKQQHSGAIVVRNPPPTVVKTFCEVDQVQFVIKQLEKDLYTRQAIISIWDPGLECTVEETKDYPCNNWIHFMVRDGKLNCEVVVRSNDLLWGFSAINMYEWTVLQELIAGHLDIPVGRYIHYTSSMHLYENHWDKAKKLIDTNYFTCIGGHIPPFKFVEGKIDINNYFKSIEEICKHFEVYAGIKEESWDLEVMGCPKPLMHCFHLLTCFARLKKAKDRNDLSPDDWDKYYKTMGYIPFSDLKVSCHYYVVRNFEKIKGYPMKEAIEDVKDMK